MENKLFVRRFETSIQIAENPEFNGAISMSLKQAALLRETLQRAESENFIVERLSDPEACFLAL